MSSQRILSGILSRYPRATSLQKATCPNAIQPFLVSSVRGYSTKQPFKVVDFHGIQQLIKSSSNKDYVLLDVREGGEVADGYIPTAKNVPLTEFEYAWRLSDKDFKEFYGFDKPKKSDKIIAYCLKGIRSTTAAEYLSDLGYTNIENYVGSYDDYIRKL
ncbi:hypothetical protein RO3G_05736 [Rhizopus delemar RA 99-880]|uniref:Rhodanese domain-containing protein n=1 Tax=Rhizopus delemar (strain RA 99-880 / ATCC MYA-4621 / FGSC 9543 / NRRL 43880) TaxID=246409 RepID=I1BXV1_RHIO9|nr:hypothetical protein RO3G_05736 [Rhizopus delemar RA 99-880]|eukprot:EIE81031.1 hypothetical protein RO3G_05736 [Rhizopus delemar RA 99-880]